MTLTDAVLLALALGVSLRVDALAGGHDSTLEVDAAKRPDLSPLIKASEAIGSVLRDGDVVIYESTVYPGCTEEVCVPILERVSRLKYAGDDGATAGAFFCGYSPSASTPATRPTGSPTSAR